ncbi:MAG TPA: HipA family kinase [Verrucomicrobiae bacterium]|jgi:hypothetical protein|nr:HipA family kinase [Verrucomicrobiae bacterium]
MINIVEIIARSEQGVTKPFLCRGDNGLQYFVKGHGAGRRALINEWIAGNLGRRLGLPIPDFQLASIPAELINFSARDDAHDLGVGVGFASQLVENADELSYLFIEQIPLELRAKILLFDWWVCNGDRTLTPDGGNPNLLWVHRDHKLFVIDQNVALDEDMSGFWDEHIFHVDFNQWTPQFRGEMAGAMRTALLELDEWWQTMPASWTEIEMGLDFQQVKTLLWRFEENADIFWRTR